MNSNKEPSLTVLHNPCVAPATRFSVSSSSMDGSARLTGDTSPSGRLIVNADDWGRTYATTSRTLDCFLHGTISSVSAMVFMQDSERAAAIAQQRRIDAGVHLNFTTPFSASPALPRLNEHQHKLARYLLRHRLNQCVFHPGLAVSFEYVVKAQLEEFQRLYGEEANRIDGHHHMHLCANVLFGGLLPAGTVVRPHFSFAPGEKNWGNRLYRKIVDRLLTKNHPLVDYFFSLCPLDPSSRLDRMFSRASRSIVEVETHPSNPEEYLFLIGEKVWLHIQGVQIASWYAVPRRTRHKTAQHCFETQ